MGNTYQQITKNEMIELLEPAGFQQIAVPNVTELVWDRTFKSHPTLSIRVFSSVGIDGNSRECGQDAIRLVIWDHRINKPITGACRTNRVAGWKDRIKEKTRSICKSLKLVKCAHCGAYMMKRTGKHGTFLGCSNFPNCSNKNTTKGLDK